MNKMNRIRIPSDLVKVNEIFKKNGYKAYLVGGAVRDMLRNRKCMTGIWLPMRHQSKS